MNVSTNTTRSPIPVDAFLADLADAELSGRPSFAEMIDALPAAIYTTDAEGRLTHFNPAAVQFAGRQPTLGSERWCVTWKLYYPDGRPMPLDECPMAIALKQRRPIRGVEAIAERPDGTRVWFEPYPTPLFDRQGTLVGGINLLLDITERKAAERAGGRLAAIVESSDDAIISKDLDGVITSWNQGAERIFGYTAQEAVGQSVTMLLPSDRFDEEPSILQRIRRGERIDHYETIRRRKDGTFLDVSLTVSPLLDANGKVVGASKIARDITDRKRAEEALRDADRRKDEFLAMLAHELRNPLAPILNAMSILQAAGRDAETLNQTREMMDRQLGQMVRLVDDLFDVSRIGQGKIQLKKDRVDLAAVVRHALEAARPACERKGHGLTVTLPARPVFVHGDSTRLAQVVGNLLNNACKFTEPGGSIRLVVALEDGQALVRVQDSGIGIAADQLPRIFEMFTQLDGSLERSSSGLGLGLTLAKRLVELHGGTLAARSAGPGKGSEFEVRLPSLVEAPEPSPRAPRGEPAAAVVPRRILVVDDNRDSADSLALLLRISGHQVHTAYDGLGAVDGAATFRPDVVLLDIGLPKLNGYEAGRRIREQQRDRSVTLVALTGWSQEKDRRRSEEAGFDAHMVKPVELAALSKLLRELDAR